MGSNSYKMMHRDGSLYFCVFKSEIFFKQIHEWCTDTQTVNETSEDDQNIQESDPLFKQEDVIKDSTTPSLLV